MTKDCRSNGRCAVCGAEGEVFVCASQCGATSFAYCKDCLKSGAEPWGDLALYISCAGYYPEDINQQYQNIVKATCKRLNRSEEEFSKLVRKLADDPCGF